MFSQFRGASPERRRRASSARCSPAAAGNLRTAPEQSRGGRSRPGCPRVRSSSKGVSGGIDGKPKKNVKFNTDKEREGQKKGLVKKTYQHKDQQNKVRTNEKTSGQIWQALGQRPFPGKKKVRVTAKKSANGDRERQLKILNGVKYRG